MNIKLKREYAENYTESRLNVEIANRHSAMDLNFLCVSNIVIVLCYSTAQHTTPWQIHAARGLDKVYGRDARMRSIYYVWFSFYL